MMICFCGMVDRWKVFSLFSSWDHCQRSSSSPVFSGQQIIQKAIFLGCHYPWDNCPGALIWGQSSRRQLSSNDAYTCIYIYIYIHKYIYIYIYIIYIYLLYIYIILDICIFILTNSWIHCKFRIVCMHGVLTLLNRQPTFGLYPPLGLTKTLHCSSIHSSTPGDYDLWPLKRSELSVADKCVDTAFTIK